MTSCDADMLNASISEALTLGNLCIMPPKQDGSKRPYPGNWTEYQKRKSTTEELLDWYSNGLTGFGIVCGAVSGQLEVMDFDQRDIYPEYRQSCIDAGLGPLVERLEKGYMEHTPNGLHWLYRCPEIAGNTKLATRPTDPAEMKDQHDKVKVLIETRGEGGYIVAAPTFGTVHPSGISYQLVSGSLSTIPEITPEERRDLHAIARMFHRLPPEKAAAESTRATDNTKRASGRVGDDFNARARWEDILVGWTLAYERGGVPHLRRPGKDEGVSGTIGWQGTDLFYCFTSSTELEHNRAYDKFGAYAAIHHGGDMKAAARDLGRQGYGDQGPKETREQATAAKPWPHHLDFKQLAKKQPAPPAFVMKDWLPCGYATLFAGHGGIGKSGLALVLAVCMAMGLSFFGLPVERRRVMYLSCEDREGVLHWRLIKICAFLGICLEDLDGWLIALDLVGYETILYQPKQNGSPLTGAYHQLAERMKAGEIEVLMIDGISDTYDGNENARAEVKAYVNATLALIPAERGAVILIGHVSKPMNGHKTTEGYSGSTGWHNSVRARWYLYPEAKRAGEEGLAERTGDLLLELQKSNLGPTDGCLRFAWDDNAGMFTGAVDQAESNFDRNYRDRTEQEGILAALRASTVPVPAAASGQRTAFHVLSVQDNFPESLRAGNAERKRFWRHIERLRAIGEIAEECITRSDRHKVRVLVAQTQSTSACGHAGNAGTEHSPHNGRNPLCGHAGNAAGGYKGGPAPAHPPETEATLFPDWARG